MIAVRLDPRLAPRLADEKPMGRRLSFPVRPRRQAFFWAAAALVLLGIFIIWERRAPNAMLPLRFLANPAFTLANAAVVLMTFSLFGLLFMLTQYFQSVLNYEPLVAGLVQLPVVAVFTVVTSQSTKIVARLGTKRTVAPPPGKLPCVFSSCPNRVSAAATRTSLAR